MSAAIPRPGYITSGHAGPDRAPTQIINDSEEFTRLAKACRVAAEVLNTVGRNVAIGVTTDELDEIAHDAYIERGAYPSTLNYQGWLATRSEAAIVTADRGDIEALARAAIRALNIIDV